MYSSLNPYALPPTETGSQHAPPPCDAPTASTCTPEYPGRPKGALATWASLAFSALVLVLAVFLALAGIRTLAGRAAQPEALLAAVRGTLGAKTAMEPLPATPEIPAGNGTYLNALPGLLQNPELPNGCEATSLAIALGYWGFDADKQDLAYNHIPRQDFTNTDTGCHGPDPALAYAGDPASSFGFYCLAPAVAQGANAFLQEAGSALQAHDISGSDTAALESWLDQGCPVVFWMTLDGSAPRTAPRFYWLLPDGTEYHPFSNLHCVVLRGYDSTSFYLCDPLQGEVKIDKVTAMDSYQALGANAVVVCP